MNNPSGRRKTDYRTAIQFASSHPGTNSYIRLRPGVARQLLTGCKQYHGVDTMDLIELATERTRGRLIPRDRATAIALIESVRCGR